MRATIEEYLDLSNRELKRKLLAAIAPLTGMYDVTATPRRLSRSGAQQRYYFACVVRPFADFLREQGEGITDQQAHELIKSKFLSVTVMNKATGELIGDVTRSTTELDVAAMSEYLDKAIAWLDTTFGILCPSPAPYLTQEPRP